MAELFSKSLTKEELQNLREDFDALDSDKDGRVSVDEMGTLMKCLGHNPTKEELQKIIDSADLNGNGTLEFDEFVAMMTRPRSAEELAEDIREAFRALDRNGDGYITADELRHVMTNLGEKLTDNEVQSMIAEADVNGDGRIDYNEFAKKITEKT